MNKHQQGFTLIELVVVIVLLGIVGAVATAKFQNLAGEAREATGDAIAAEIQSGSAINYASSAVDPTKASITWVDVNDGGVCATLAASLLQSGALPGGGWTVAGGPITCAAAGDADSTCTLNNSTNALAADIPLTIICTGP